VRYVVTGAAGFIGSHLARALLEAGHQVVGADCFNDYYDPGLKEENAEGLEVLRVDLASEPIDELLAGADGVFHLAGQPGVRSFGDVFPDYVSRNLVASQRVFEAAAARGCRVVFSSSSSVYGDAEAYPTTEDAGARPLSPYGITKLGCEHLASAYRTSFSLDVVVLRYFTVYGPGQRPDMAFARIAGALAEERTFELYGDGSHSRGCTYVGDVVSATVAAMERGVSGATLNVGGGSEATMLEVIGLLERISGRRLDLRVGPPAAGDVLRTAADTSRIREALGWNPQVSLEQGLRAQWEWASKRVAAR